jgi:hypothetical protein
MGIRFYCPNGHKLNVKDFQAGQKGICPHCGAKTEIPLQSTRRSTKEIKALKARKRAPASPAGNAATTLPPVPENKSGAPKTPFGQMPPNVAAGGANASSPSQPLPTAGGASTPILTQASQMPPTTLVRTSVKDFVEQSNPVPASAQPMPPPVAQPPGAADPLAEAGGAVWYVRHPSIGQFGPAAGDVMRSWLAEGRVSADSLVWREGWKDWRKASDVFSQLGSTPAFQNLEDIIGADASSTFSNAARPHRPVVHKKFKGVPTHIIVMLAAALVILIVVLGIILFR